MEQLNISLNKGIRRTPSFTGNGELEECVGLYVKNGELKNVPRMSKMKDGDGSDFELFATDQVLLAIHYTDGVKILICRYPNREGSTIVSWGIASYKIEDGAERVYSPFPFFTTSENVQIMTIGRMMLALDENGLHYFIWKNNAYLYLGDKIPELPISFSLTGEMELGAVGENAGSSGRTSDTSGITINVGAPLSGGGSHLETITNQLYALAAKMTNQAGEAGKFTHPFLVRYALRLYDGTNTNISAPVLMMVSSNELFIQCQGFGSQSTYIYCGMMKAQLEYQIRQNILSRFDNWRDVVKGVDIYVSAPIYTYNPAADKLYGEGEQPGWAWPITVDTLQYYGYSVCKLPGMYANWGDFYTNRNKYMKRDMALCYVTQFSRASGTPANLKNWNALLQLEPKPKEQLQEEMRGDCPYYLLRSYDLDELNTQGVRTAVGVESKRINNIVLQQRLVESESFSDIKKVGSSLVYNRRLDMSNIEVSVEMKAELSQLLPFTNGYQDYEIETDPQTASEAYLSPLAFEGTQSYRLAVEVDSGGVNPFVVDDSSLASEGTALNLRSSLHLLSYMDDMAERVWIYQVGSSPKSGISLNLSKNVLLKATHWLSLDQLTVSQVTQELTVPQLTSDNRRKYTNKLIVSEPENPFVFSETNAYDVGAGTIIRLATMREPLSIGQFGQFPMIAFCTDGMWALEVNPEDGTFKTPAPASPDVLCDNGIVLSVEGGVLYVTKQGLKVIGENKKIDLLSANLEGKNIDEDIFVGPGTPIRQYVSAWAPLLVKDTLEIREALQTCRLAYDNKNNLIHIFFSGANRQLILNLKTLEFSSQVEALGNPSGIVEDYTTSIVQYPDSIYLYVYDSAPDATNKYRGFVLSRILNFGQANLYANIMQMKTYHDLDETAVSGIPVSCCKTALYVSNDKVSWKLLTSLKGASYKYYRFALFTCMTDLEAVSGLSMLYSPERTNKLR